MATLWTGSLTTKAQDYNVDAYVFDAEIIENSVDNANNKSNVTVNMYAKGIAGYNYSISGPTAYINIDGDRKVTSNVTYINSTRRLISTWTGDIIHNDDGTKTIRVTFNYSPNSGASYLPQSSKLTADAVALTSIPRYATINSFTVAQRDETSFTFSFTANAICDYIWYSTNNGNNWTGLDITDGTSATFNVTGLSANTSYNCKLRVRRKDSQLNTDSSVVAKSTYDYPKVAYVGSSELTIGNEQTLTIYNPLGRNITIKMNKTNVSGTQLYSGTSSTAGQSVLFKFTPNATTMYNSIPNDASASCVYSVVYSNISTKTTTGNYTYKIKGNEYPTFADANWSYSANLTSLTNDNQVAIDNQSTITVTIDNVATSSYGANIDKYAIKWGTGETKYIQAGSTSTTVTGNGNSLIVTVYDKRGLPKETIKTINNISYINISINNDINTERTNGVEAGTKLNLSGTFYNAKFGTNGVQNTLYSAKYYVSTNGTTWSSAYPSGDAMKNAITVNGNNFALDDFDIHANGSSGGFTIGTRYYVKVEIKDAQGLLSMATATTTVTDGKIGRDVYQDSNGDYHTGINGLADSNYNEKVYGDFNATNDINASNHLKEKGYQITQIDITGTSTSLLNRTKDLANNSIYQAVWFSRTDGGTSNIIDKPTGNTNTGFICYANCNRWVSTSDWRYILTAYAGTSSDVYVAVVTQGSTGIDWKRPTNKVPTNHASSATTYGVGTGSNYGHCKTINNLTTSSYSDGNALSAYQGYVLNQKFNYSTTEKEIGTWIDGSTVYARTISLNFVDTISQSWTTVASVSGWNIKYIVDSVLLANTGIAWTGYFLRVNNNNLQVWNGMPSNWPVQWVVLYYTKN